MSDHFVKIYGSILKSSIWGESKDVRILWVAMLADADSTGFVEGSTSGLARTANLSLAETQAALKVLESPDLDSKSQKYGGRRIEKVEGGWQLLNYQEYRDRRTESQVKRAERQRRWREKKRAEEERLRVDGVDAQKGEGRGERGEGSQGEIGSDGESETTDTSSGADAPNRLPVKRDQRWVQAFIEKLTQEDWSRARSRKEAVVAFQFYRWIAGVKTRMVFSDERERVAKKMIEQYGLVRVMFAIVGQRTHPDFNQSDRSFLGWDNLFRKEKGYAAIEKCSDHALRREGAAKKVLKALAQLQQERGWFPSEADAELFESIGGNE